MCQTTVERLFDRVWPSHIRKVASLFAQALSNLLLETLSPIQTGQDRRQAWGSAGYYGRLVRSQREPGFRRGCIRHWTGAMGTKKAGAQ
jgi:hypothetical protein